LPTFPGGDCVVLQQRRPQSKRSLVLTIQISFIFKVFYDSLIHRNL